MNEAEKRSIIERYLNAYNTFNIEGMMSLLHPEIEFQNISGGEVNARASGADEFRNLAEQSKELFTSRKQTIVNFQIKDERVLCRYRDYQEL